MQKRIYFRRAKVTIEEYKAKCIESIDKERQPGKAQEASGNRPMEYYHRGRKEVLVDVHDVLVRWF
jgi:hypothetical protein